MYMRERSEEYVEGSKDGQNFSQTFLRRHEKDSGVDRTPTTILECVGLVTGMFKYQWSDVTRKSGRTSNRTWRRSVERDQWRGLTLLIECVGREIEGTG